MINSIEKPKIPKDYSFVLKTKQLEDLLINNNINIHVDLIYCWHPKQIGSIFEVHFWPPNANVPYERLYIRVGALLKEDAFIAREKMTEIVLPEFVAWFKKISILNENSPIAKTKLRFEVVFQNEGAENIKITYCRA